MDINRVVEAFQHIARARGWEELHTPKNLAMALNVEAAELLEHFQWLSDAQSLALKDQPADKAAVAAEAADVLMYLLALCQQLDIDLEAALEDKISVNQQRFIDPQ